MSLTSPPFIGMNKKKQDFVVHCRCLSSLNTKNQNNFGNEVCYLSQEIIFSVTSATLGKKAPVFIGFFRHGGVIRFDVHGLSGLAGARRTVERRHPIPHTFSR